MSVPAVVEILVLDEIRMIRRNIFLELSSRIANTLGRIRIFSILAATAEENRSMNISISSMRTI